MDPSTMSSDLRIPLKISVFSIHGISSMSSFRTIFFLFLCLLSSRARNMVTNLLPIPSRVARYLAHMYR